MHSLAYGAAAATVLSLAFRPPVTSPSAGWLAGCWALQQGNRLVEETWLPERGGVMLGMSRASVGSELREFEFVMLKAVGSTLEYRVQAGTQPEVVFRARNPTAKEVVFENPEHDYPKRVGYRLVTRDSIEAWIDDGEGNTGKRLDYPYHRVDCVKAG